MAEHYTSRERVEAIMALALSRKAPVGAKPSEEELAAYIDGALSAQRAAEIESHLAHDNELYEQWLTIVEMLEVVKPVIAAKPAVAAEPKENPVSRFMLWITGGGVGATAIAALSMFYILPALYFNQMESGVTQSYDYFMTVYDDQGIAKRWPITPTQPKTTTKSFDFGTVEIQLSEQQHAFAVGVRSGLNRLVPRDGYWTSVLDQLPTAHQACSESGCEKRQTALAKAGEYAAVAYAACEYQTGVNDSFWNKQPETINAMAKVLKRYDEAAPIYAFFAEWQQGFADGDDPHPAICARIDALLQTGLQ